MEAFVMVSLHVPAVPFPARCGEEQGAAKAAGSHQASFWGFYARCSEPRLFIFTRPLRSRHAAPPEGEPLFI